MKGSFIVLLLVTMTVSAEKNLNKIDAKNEAPVEQTQGKERQLGKNDENAMNHPLNHPFNFHMMMNPMLNPMMNPMFNPMLMMMNPFLMSMMMNPMMMSMMNMGMVNMFNPYMLHGMYPYMGGYGQKQANDDDPDVRKLQENSQFNMPLMDQPGADGFRMDRFLKDWKDKLGEDVFNKEVEKFKKRIGKDLK